MKGQTKLLKHVYNRYIAKERVPAFLIPNKNIKTLLTPPEFYNTIIEGIKSSKYRILISSLYIGTGQLERQLVDTLIDSSNKNPKLIVKILVDKNRGQRKGKSGESTFTLLQSAMDRAQFPENLKFSFIWANGLNRRYDPYAKQFGEGKGTFHSKVAIFDDSILLTGANCSEDYFVNRKDRYVVFDDSREFSDYLEDFFDCFLDLGDKVVRGEKQPRIDFEKYNKYTERLSQRFNLFKYNTQINDEKLAIIDQYVKDYYQNNVDQSLLTVSNEQGQYNTSKEKSNFDKAIVIPAFQIPIINYKGDEVLMKDLFNQIKDNDLVEKANLTIASGYFNPLNEFLPIFKGMPDVLRTQFVTGSPLTNSFHNGGTLKGKIPAVYRLSLLNWIQGLKGRDNFEFFEYYKERTTYHTKGLWYWHCSKDFTEYMTIVGSSNYAQRSYIRDTEGQFIVFQNNCENTIEFEKERKALFEYGVPITEEIIKNDEVTKLNWAVKILYYCFKGFV